MNKTLNVFSIEIKTTKKQIILTDNTSQNNNVTFCDNIVTFLEDCLCQTKTVLWIFDLSLVVRSDKNYCHLSKSLFFLLMLLFDVVASTAVAVTTT